MARSFSLGLGTFLDPLHLRDLRAAGCHLEMGEGREPLWGGGNRRVSSKSWKRRKTGLM
jgi:hypothetical protein